MRVVDPFQRRPSRVGCGRKSCVCGCMLGLIAAALSLPVVVGWLLRAGPIPASRYDHAEARTLQRKIDTLGAYYDPTKLLRSDMMPTTALKESEINSYLVEARDKLQSPAREAVQDVHVGLQEGQFLIQAAVDLNKL